MNKLVCVVGLGYIGLPTAALLASAGYSVVGVDKNPHIIESVNQGKAHIVEPDLDISVRSAVASNRLKVGEVVLASDIYIICVPTPFHEGGDIPQPNIDFVLTATKEISFLLKAGDILILESTCPVGTTEKIKNTLKSLGVNIDAISIAYCPERVLPGKIMKELIENDRVVGGLTPNATRTVSEFYKTFVKGNILETDAKTAEMCKLTENSFRDVNIAFANELSLICEKEGINVWNLIQLANRHPRVNILSPGVGVGGHCIAVDPWFIVSKDPSNSRLIKTAREINNHKKEWVINQIKNSANKKSKQLGRLPVLACFGLSFKPDIDDLRESPALEIAKRLHDEGYPVIAVEPNIKSLDEIKLVRTEEALVISDINIVLVKHSEFLERDIINKKSNTEILDFCGMFV